LDITIEVVVLWVGYVLRVVHDGLSRTIATATWASNFQLFPRENFFLVKFKTINESTMMSCNEA